jgi:hypothetical protein
MPRDLFSALRRLVRDRIEGLSDPYDVGDIDRRLDSAERRQRLIEARLRLMELEADPRRFASEWYAPQESRGEGDADDRG